MDGIFPYFPSKMLHFPSVFIFFCSFDSDLEKSEDLYSDAQVASHPWFLSTPYFRCHHADVSLSLHLLPIESHFWIFAFSMSSGKCSFSLLLPYGFFFSFFRLCPHPFEWAKSVSVHSFTPTVWVKCHWSALLSTWETFWWLPLLTSHLNIKLPCRASSAICDT